MFKGRKKEKDIVQRQQIKTKESKYQKKPGSSRFSTLMMVVTKPHMYANKNHIFNFLIVL